MPSSEPWVTMGQGLCLHTGAAVSRRQAQCLDAHEEKLLPEWRTGEPICVAGGEPEPQQGARQEHLFPWQHACYLTRILQDEPGELPDAKSEALCKVLYGSI